MNNLATLIQQAVERKQGNREFALSFDGDSRWFAEIGNTCTYVRIGESDGEFIGEGSTPEDAVRALIGVMP